MQYAPNTDDTDVTNFALRQWEWLTDSIITLNKAQKINQKPESKPRQDSGLHLRHKTCWSVCGCACGYTYWWSDKPPVSGCVSQ